MSVGKGMSSLLSTLYIFIFVLFSSDFLLRRMRRTSALAASEAIHGESGGGRRQRTGADVSHVFYYFHHDNYLSHQCRQEADEENNCARGGDELRNWTRANATNGCLH